MILTWELELGRCFSIPRESGDDPWDAVVQWLNSVYSPRERG